MLTPAMDASDPADPTGPRDAGSAAGPGAGPSVTAGGRGTWITIGVIGVLLIITVALTLTGGSVTNDAVRATPAATADDGPCAPTVTEPLDPNSVIRLLPNAPRPGYESDPPTSGAFEVGPQVPPVSTAELSGPVQVGLLAEGKVLLQYRDLSTDDVARLQALAGTAVVVAPNSALTSPVVATAWRTRQVCTALETEVLLRFVTLNADRGPQTGPNGTGPPTTR
jgi:hypothetical protein